MLLFLITQSVFCKEIEWFFGNFETEFVYYTMVQNHDESVVGCCATGTVATAGSGGTGGVVPDGVINVCETG